MCDSNPSAEWPTGDMCVFDTRKLPAKFVPRYIPSSPKAQLLHLPTVGLGACREPRKKQVVATLWCLRHDCRSHI